MCLALNTHIHACFTHRRCCSLMVTLTSTFPHLRPLPPAMPFPRSVSTPTSPRRATPPSRPESGFLANLTPSTDSKRIHQQSNERSLNRLPEAMNRLIPRSGGGGTHPTQEENSQATQHAWAQQIWHLVCPACETCAHECPSTDG